MKPKKKLSRSVKVSKRLRQESKKKSLIEKCTWSLHGAFAKSQKVKGSQVSNAESKSSFDLRLDFKAKSKS